MTTRTLQTLAALALAGATTLAAAQAPAPNEELIREHARRSGFPANRITPIAAVLDPTTARP